jgi:hypothetical protein
MLDSLKLVFAYAQSCIRGYRESEKQIRDKWQFVEALAKQGAYTSGVFLPHILKPDGQYAGFYTDPASTKYHCAYQGGLFDHSVNVLEKAMDLFPVFFKEDDWDAFEGMFLACMCHDICKVGQYDISTRNVKDDMGNWHQVPMYVAKPATPWGHGLESLERIRKFDKIHMPEGWELAVMYHMGIYDLAQGQWNAHREAMRKYPHVMLLHTADMMAALYTESPS